MRSITADRSWPVTTSFDEPLVASGIDLVVLDDAVHDDLRQAAEGDDEDHAQQRDRRVAGQQEQGLQDRVVREREGELEAAAARSPTRSPRPTTNASMTGLGTGTASTGPASSVRYSGLAIAGSRRQTPAASGIRIVRPGCAVSASGSVALLASQIIQYSDGSPRNRAARLSSRSPSDDDVGWRRGVDDGLRDEPPGQVHYRRPVGQREVLDRRAVVAAVRVRRAAGSGGRGDQRRE